MPLTKDLTPHKDLQKFFLNLTWTRKTEDLTGKMGDTSLKQNALQFLRSQISVYNMVSDAQKNLQQVFMLMGNIFKGDPIILMQRISPFECPETTKPPLDLPFPHIQKCRAIIYVPFQVVFHQS